jgi:hypothetical protein
VPEDLKDLWEGVTGSAYNSSLKAL